MRDKISNHYMFDDKRYWEFSRRSGIPRGYFSTWSEELGHFLVGALGWIGCPLLIILALAGWFA